MNIVLCVFGAVLLLPSVMMLLVPFLHFGKLFGKTFHLNYFTRKKVKEE